MIKKVDHIGIMVSDMEKSISFYQDVLGLKLKDRVPHTDGIIELAFLGLGTDSETEVELIKGYNDSLPAEGKVHHFAVSVENISEEYLKMKELGYVEIIDPEIVILPNGYKYFFIKGPDKEWIELFQR
ncbi:VOC family protein [Peribacillus sp. SCS-37]|uniref:VOC family protein n=1 Tax=Paraperibacillus esterisolvens TaxID=3115296 RepID=UPI0039057F0A